MGLYHDRVLPHVVELTCGGAKMEKWRRKATDGLHGTVVEIGFGSGLNVPCYPDEVERVVAVEPSTVARRMAAERVAASPVLVEHVGLDGQSIPLPDDSCDTALCTFTLCTIPDVDRALAELRRVVRPGGTFHFLEHGSAPDPGVRRWQQRLEPIQKRMGGGCHLTRDTVDVITGGGFEILDVESRYMAGPKPYTFFTWGRARNPEVVG